MCMYTHTHVHTQIHINTCTRVYTHIYVFVFVVESPCDSHCKLQTLYHPKCKSPLMCDSWNMMHFMWELQIFIYHILYIIYHISYILHIRSHIGEKKGRDDLGRVQVRTRAHPRPARETVPARFGRVGRDAEDVGASSCHNATGVGRKLGCKFRSPWILV